MQFCFRQILHFGFNLLTNIVLSLKPLKHVKMSILHLFSFSLVIYPQASKHTPCTLSLKIKVKKWGSSLTELIWDVGGD